MDYPNLLLEAGIAASEIDDRVNEVWRELTRGPCRIYEEVGEDLGYFTDTGNDDVRTEGMSYGMMMAVQMNDKDVFDRLWRWSLKYMHHDSGKYEDYFAWSCNLDGTRRAEGPAPDGEEYYAMALFFASNRWGDGQPPLDYSAQARRILRACLHKGELSMWDKETKLIKFIPETPFTDPSYHLPHFYELFALRADEEDRAFWKEAAISSRAFLHLACNEKTGLAPNITAFDGKPLPVPEEQKDNIWANLGGCYFSDAYRVAINIALDSVWFNKDPWQSEIADTLQSYVYENEEPSKYVLYPDGRIFEREPIMHPPGMKASWACASLAAKGKYRLKAARDFFNMPLRTDKRRYYDNCLYFFTLLALSGNYKIY
jgi:oligosaccharide reducing-end xylanase